MSYTNYSFDLNIGEGLCTFTSFHFLDSGLYLTNGFDFYFGLFWMAWDWKPAIKRRGYLITVKTRVGRVQLYHVRLIVLLIVVVVDSFFFCGERSRLEASSALTFLPRLWLGCCGGARSAIEGWFERAQSASGLWGVTGSLHSHLLSSVINSKILRKTSRATGNKITHLLCTEWEW